MLWLLSLLFAVVVGKDLIDPQIFLVGLGMGVGEGEKGMKSNHSLLWLSRWTPDFSVPIGDWLGKLPAKY